MLGFCEKEKNSADSYNYLIKKSSDGIVKI